MTTTPTLWLDSFQVNTSSTGFQGHQKIIGLSNGNFLVVYADDSGTVGSGSGRDIIGVIYDAEGTIVTTAFQVNQSFFADEEELPSIAATNDGGFMMAFEDRDTNGQSIRLERYDASGTQVDFVTVQSDPGTPFVSQPSIAVDLSDNSVFVSYQWSDGNDDSIRGKAFDSNLTVAAGTPADGHVIRSDEDTTSAAIGAFDNDTTVLTNGTYVTVYTEVDTNRGIEIRGSDATTGANSFNVNVGTTGSNGVPDFDPHVAALTGGGFVVVWQEDEGTNDNIVFARYNSSGVLQGSVTTVVDTTNNYFQPRVIGLEDGGFFIAAVDSTADAIEGTRYDATGALVGTVMFTMETGITNTPDIDLGLTSDGRILLTWDDPSGDVQAKIFDPRDTTINADPGDGQITARISEDTTINGSSSADIIFGQAGNDVLFGGGGADIIYGGVGNDTIEGGFGGDSAFGGSGDDLIRATLGGLIDDIFGGTGTDTADYSASGSAVNVDLAAGTVTGFGGPKTIDSVENVIGTDQDDTIIGNAALNEISGGGGNDLLQGGFSTDTIFGGTGNDTIQVLHGQFIDDVFGGGGFDVFDISDETVTGVNIDLLADTITGLGGTQTIAAIDEVIGTQVADTIAGEFGTQTLRGEGGDDLLTSGNGEFIDNLFGGAGTDTFDNSAQTNASGGLDIDMGAGTMSGMNSGLTIDSIENVIGTTQGDTIIGDGAANSFAGGAGNDSLHGGSGSDILSGGADDDTLNGGLDTDSVFGGNGDDIVLDTDGTTSDSYDGGGGNDHLNYSVIAFVAGIIFDNNLGFVGDGVGGAVDDDTFTNFETIIASQGDDILVSKGTGSTMLGAGGDDTVHAGLGTFEKLDGGSGTDTLDTTSFNGDYAVDLATGLTNLGDETFTNFENLATGAGNDTLTGTSGANSMDGGAGNDTIYGGSGNDFLYGGDDNDFIAGGGSGAGNVDTAFGGNGDDRLARGGGNTGEDAYFGGDGIDTIDTNGMNFVATVVFDLGANEARVFGGFLEIWDGFENYDGSGGFGDEDVIGTSGANTIATGSGANSIHGAGGDDMIFGGAGDDTVEGGAGADSLDGGFASDTLSYASSAAGVTVDLGTGSVSGGDAAGDTIAGFENVTGSSAGGNTLTGDFGNNVLTGGDGAPSDALFGGAGSDTLYGGGGNDALIGGDGADTFFGGDGVNDLMITGDDGAVDHFDGGAGIADVVSYFSSGTGVTVNLANQAANAGAAASETYTGVEGIRGAGAAANTLIGDAGGNVLIGGSAADSISSGAGSDIIYGGDGNDVMDAGDDIDIIRGDQGDDSLTGGGGGDIFKMKGIDGNDTITDFAVLSDKVEFQVAGVTGFGDLVFQDLGGGDSKVTAGSVSVTFLGVSLSDIQQAGNFDFI